MARAKNETTEREKIDATVGLDFSTDGRGAYEGIQENVAAARDKKKQKNKGRKETAYVQLDVKEYEDYLRRMAKHTGKNTLSKYLISIIEEDYRINKALYERSLKDNPKFNWERKESPNSKEAKARKLANQET